MAFQIQKPLQETGVLHRWMRKANAILRSDGGPAIDESDQKKKFSAQRRKVRKGLKDDHLLTLHGVAHFLEKSGKPELLDGHRNVEQITPYHPSAEQIAIEREVEAEREALSRFLLEKVAKGDKVLKLVLTHIMMEDNSDIKKTKQIAESTGLDERLVTAAKERMQYRLKKLGVQRIADLICEGDQG